MVSYATRRPAKRRTPWKSVLVALVVGYVCAEKGLDLTFVISWFFP
jgi:uncharacterized protein (DUF608 family)